MMPATAAQPPCSHHGTQASAFARLAPCLAALLVLALSACEGAGKTAKSVVAATEVKPSDWLAHGTQLKEDRKRSPFLGNWHTTDKKLQAAADACRSIHVAPVVYDHIRPLKSFFSRWEYGNWRRKRNLPALASYTQKHFAEAFRKAKDPRYAVADAPQPDSLILELSLLEWSPNTYTGIILREAVDLVTFDFVGEATMKGTRGSIAIEGRLLEPRTRQPVYEFADKEVGKIVLLLPLQDFYPTGQAHYAIREWAKQLEKLLRSSPKDKVSDSLPLTLWNF